MKTLQEIFDYGLNHIRQQGAQCIKDGGTDCAYRNAAGHSCIVGGFFTAENYDPEFDSGKCGGPAVTLMVKRSSAFNDELDQAGVDTEDWQVVSLLSEMQGCHDKVVFGGGDGEFIRDFNRRMQDLANRLGLNYTPPTQ